MKKEILVLASLVLCLFAFSGMVSAAPDVQGPGPISHPTTASAYVPGWMSLTLSPDSITFSNATRDADLNPTEVSDPEDLTITIGPETNVDVKIGTSTQLKVFSDGIHTFGVGNMEWKVGLGGYNDYLDCPILACSILTTDVPKTCTITNQLTIPSGQASGTYTTSIVITGRPGVFPACGPNCNNNGICDDGENNANCPLDCPTS